MADDEEVKLARLEEQFRAYKAANDAEIAALAERVGSIETKGWGILAAVGTYVGTKLLDLLDLNGGP